MYVIFLAGGIASGKSTIARQLEQLGALRVDLDELSRDVCRAGSPVLDELAERFGDDILDPQTGELRRGVLASRAFIDDETRSQLEAIELPAIKERLVGVLTNSCCMAIHPDVCVVEVPLLDRVEDLFDLADCIMVVDVPYGKRLERAVGRGMTVADFVARAQAQPTDEYLRAHATCVIDNSRDEAFSAEQVSSFWREHEVEGWRGRAMS